jgi:flagellin-like protein
MRKGITPVIAIIVLLLITVALAAFAYTFISGLFTGQTEKHMTIIPNGAYCDGETITVLARNNGIQTPITYEDLMVVEIKGPSGTTTIDKDSIPATDILPDGDLESQQTGKILETNCGGGCPSGYNTVSFITNAGRFSTGVYC